RARGTRRKPGSVRRSRLGHGSIHRTTDLGPRDRTGARSAYDGRYLMRIVITITLLTGAASASLAGQATPATARADSQASARPAVFAPSRAAWLSDRLPIRVGDILTVMVDEQTVANERVSTTAQANRSQRAQLGIGVDSAFRLGPSKDFSTVHNTSTTAMGEAPQP